MKSIAIVILESILATAVVVFCLVLPQALHFPSWAFALSAFPILMYLTWRLGGRAFTWRSAAWLTAILAASLFVIDNLLPASWHGVSSIIIGALVVLAVLRLRKA